MKPCRHETQKAGCRLCHLAATDGRYQRLWRLPITAPFGPHPEPPPGMQSRIRYCAARKVYDWSVTDNGKVIDSGSEPDERAARVAVEAVLGAEPPKTLTTFTSDNLAPGIGGRRFNGSIIEDGNGYILAFRTGWAGSEVGLARLGADLKPTGVVKLLPLRHPAAMYGREDPRLFRHRGKLHVSYTGVDGVKGPTNMLYARLASDWLVEEIFYPQIDDRQPWEKNWTMYSHRDTLYAVYSIRPHRILRIDGDRTELAYETPGPSTWSGGHLRGGASPVLHEGVYYHWFHGRLDGAKSAYNIGLYTFEAKPPFRIQQVTPDPLMVSDSWPDYYCDPVFPAGSCRVPDGWLVSAGHGDRQIDLIHFGDQLIRARLA